MLNGLVRELQGLGVALYLAEVHTPVVEFARKSGPLAVLGENCIFPTIDAALAAVDRNLQLRFTVVPRRLTDWRDLDFGDAVG